MITLRSKTTFSCSFSDMGSTPIKHAHKMLFQNRVRWLT